MTNSEYIKNNSKEWKGKSNGHPAIWHMLDVAACAETIMGTHKFFQPLSTAQKKALLILIALHDVGKISLEFQKVINGGKGRYKHWQLSDTLLVKFLDEILSQSLNNNPTVMREFYAAVSGHHGGPPQSSNNPREIRNRQNAIGSDAIAFSKKWVHTLLDLFPNASLEGIDQWEARKLSWNLSGLVVASDWVGSNEEWFEGFLNPISPTEYLKHARKIAKFAVEQARLEPTSLNETFNGMTLTGFNNLRPMQKVVEEVELPKEPFLAIIEDITGAGKTESALILAHRMMLSGLGNGLFFALPTTATSNSMFDRMAKIAPNLFTTGPTLTLSHSKSINHEGFKSIIGKDSDNTAEANCSVWLADDRRRALLADVGVGTIDQALLGILPTRFATLRIFGVSKGILIVDEAHSYDPYTQQQLETLLTMHAMNGGSAVLMTATLPIGIRKKFVNAFCEGKGLSSTTLHHDHFPGFTIVTSAVTSHEVPSIPETNRTININRISNPQGVNNILIEGYNSGSACVWIRNSVDEAIASANELNSLGVETILLHARFTTGDRLTLENDLVARFGKNGNNRLEKILVATQVIESSMDLDFDVMVSDLAPIGSLIQRSGRLWRHLDVRPKGNRPVPGPTLNVLSPDPDEVKDENWLKDVIGVGAWVYQIGDQWLTAKYIFDHGEIRIPHDLRKSIAFVHGENTHDLPEIFMDKHYDNLGKNLAYRGRAINNVVDVFDGYLWGTKDNVWSDEKYPTRLGDETKTLVLSQWCGNRLVPWNEVDEESRSWSLSEVGVSINRLKYFDIKLPDQNIPKIQSVKEKWSKGKSDHQLLCPVDKDGIICEGLKYDKKYGLQFVK
ncbi:MAG: CRISPR-associated helicase Cas3' [Paracoccaceae bacterium]|nr:CRISPR-associated helicase Cas3' [Paracoccaceae bacterium]MDE2917211.1 CRISPR-associated helicase Cas3' [Paracoccaceae bacterium]